MRQKLDRYPSPIQRYKSNMAPILFNARSSVFPKSANQLIKQTFKQFDEKWHYIIADDYPECVAQCLEDNNEVAIHWRKVTDHLEDDFQKAWWWFEPQQIRLYLQQVHGMPTGPT